MWRKNAQTTGENSKPLGATRRWGGGSASSSQPDAYPSSYGSGAPSSNGGGASYGGSSSQGYSAYGASSGAATDVSTLKRERDDGSRMAAPTVRDGADGAPRKRRSRWGEEKTDLGVVTALGANVSQADIERHALNVRIEEIARKLRSGEVVPPERERSPSPPPTYDAQGHRTNTREVRYRRKLEEERVRLVDKQIKLDPNYRPPMEYVAAKRNMKPQEKVFLPIRDFPEINFFGLLVGPRGNTLKTMERDSGSKISIRGKGSVKSGKGRIEDENEEEMHCVVIADDEEKVKKGVRLINLVIETAASTPEAQNDHKRNQLRELASLNGTLRDDENQVCQNCGQKGHRKYECPEQRNWTAHIICHRCGQQGHLARDCTSAPGGGMGGMGRPGVGGPGLGGPGMGGPGGMMGGPPGPGGPNNGDPFNSEYENLMAELGEGSRNGNAPGASGMPGAAGPGVAMQSGPMDRPIGPDGKKIPPWRDPAMWNQPASFGFGGPPRGGPRFGGGGMGFAGAQGGYQQFPQQQQQGFGQQGGYDQAQQQGGYSGGYNAQQGAQPAAGADPQQQQQEQGGQPDYREAWEAYYRSQGMDPAAAAAAAAAAGQGAGQQQQQQPAQAAASAGNGQQDYSKEWEEYYRQQAAAGQAGYGAPQ